MASYSWEVEGYTILWVTRGTLRSDVYKNMFDMSCLERIRDYIKDGNEIPSGMAEKKRLLSKAWLPPISYKQFNNVLKRQNRLYDFLIKRNGYSDPFKKTLLIIDEAHLMLSSYLKEKEKPDIQLLKSWIRNSFKVSGENGAIGAKRTLQIKKNKPANRHGKPPSQDGGFSVYYLLTPLTLPVSHICYTTPHEHKPRKEFWGVFIKLIN